MKAGREARFFSLAIGRNPEDGHAGSTLANKPQTTQQ
jgi:hypothetical protein